jgi:hypothetical protein
VPTITPADLERATWLPFAHADAADHAVWFYRSSLSPRLIRETTIYRGCKRQPHLQGPAPINTETYKIDGEVVAYDPERICERLNGLQLLEAAMPTLKAVPS